MYQQSNRSEAIREIQTYLFFLSDKRYDSINRIPIDGVFDQETEQAVIAFQKETSLDPTGIVDYETFTTLYLEYKSAYEEFYEKPYIIGDGDLPLKENDQNDDVRTLHTMINELRKSYPEISEVGSGSYFSSRTGDAIEDIRYLFMFERSRVLDKALYSRIKREIAARKLFEEKYQ